MSDPQIVVPDIWSPQPHPPYFVSNGYLTVVVSSKPNVYLIPTIKILIFVKLQTEVLTDSIQAQLSNSHPVRPAMTVSLRIVGLGFYFRYEPTQLADT